MRSNTVGIAIFIRVLRFFFRRKKLSAFLVLMIYINATAEERGISMPSVGEIENKVLNAFFNALENPYVLATIGVLVIYIAFSLYRKYQAFMYVRQDGYSDNANDYIQHEESYERDSLIEREARTHYFLKLAELQGNRCICGDQKNGYDLDHLMIPKSEGGDFILQHKNGALISNMLILCQKCNRSKGAKDWKKFFTSSQIIKIVKIQKEMTKHINETSSIIAKK